MPSTRPELKRTTLRAIPIPSLPGWESRLVLLEFPPGMKGTQHTHPVAATGYVVDGHHVSQWEGGEVERYSTGDSFVDRGEVLHTKADNASETEPLVMLVSYVIKIGEPNVVME